METLLKRHFWVVNLLGIAIIAWLVGGSLNGFVGMKLSAASSNDIDVASLKAGAGSSALADKLASARAGGGASGAMEAASPFLIDEPPKEVEPEPEEAELPDENAPEGPLDASFEVTKLPLKLLGTMVVTPSRYSSGTMEVNRKDKKIITVGVELLGGQARVEGIFRTYVVLKESNKLTIAPLWPRPEEATSAENPRAAMAPTVRPSGSGVARPSRTAAKNTADGVKRISSTSFQLDRSMLNRKLKNLASLGQQARVVPNYHRGKYDGFRMIGMGSSSMFRDMGFSNGDIIKVINGNRIDSPNKALALYEALKNKSRLTVQIERGGMLKTLRYTVR